MKICAKSEQRQSSCHCLLFEFESECFFFFLVVFACMYVSHAFCVGSQMPPKSTTVPAMYTVPREWLEIKASTIKGAGLGLFAKAYLPPHGVIHYTGEKIPPATYQRLCHHQAKSLDHHYIMKAQSGYVIGDRDNASAVNEPAPGTVANCRPVPAALPYYYLVASVQAGQELTCNYGRHYKRWYRVGGTPKRPKWRKGKS